MVLYAPEESKTIEYKFYKGGELEKIEIKEVNHGLKPTLLGLRIILGIFKQLDQDDSNGIAVIKSNDETV